MIEQYAWLIPALPLVAALAIAFGYLLGVNRGEAGERQTTAIALGAAGLSFLLDPAARGAGGVAGRAGPGSGGRMAA